MLNLEISYRQLGLLKKLLDDKVHDIWLNYFPLTVKKMNIKEATITMQNFKTLGGSFPSDEKDDCLRIIEEIKQIERHIGEEKRSCK